MSSLSLKTKIICSALLSAVLTSIVSVVVYYNVSQMVTTNNWVKHTDNVIASFLNLQSMMIDMETGQRGFLMSGDEKFLEPYNGAKGKFEPELKKLMETVSDNPTQVQRLKDAHELEKNWIDIAVNKEMQARKDFDSKKITLVEFENIIKAGLGKISMDGFRKIISEATQMEEELNIKRQESSKLAAKATFFWVSFGLGAAVLIGFLFLWRVISSAVRSILQISVELEKSSTQVSSTAIEIASASEELSQASTEQASSLQETSASVEEISSMISSNSANAKQSIETSQKSLEFAEKGKVSVEDMIKAIATIDSSNNSIMKQVNESNNQMDDIIKIISEIGSKTKVINDIVFQTKLLSFNASVEAARAGEHGKGFAVVAEEVGKLASMSGTAAVEITVMLDSSIKKVEEIAKNTQEKVGKLIAEGKSNVETGSQIANECGVILSDIVNSVANVSKTITEISSAGQEQSQGIQEITKAIAQLDQVTQQNTGSAAESAISAQGLSKESHLLKELILELTKTIEGSDQGHKKLSQVTSDKPKLKTLKNKPVLKTSLNQEKNSTINLPKSEDHRFVDI